MNTYADIDCIPLFRRLKKAPERRQQYYAILDNDGFVDHVYKVNPREGPRSAEHVHLGDYPRIRALQLRDDSPDRVPKYRVYDGKLRESTAKEKQAWQNARPEKITPAAEAAVLQDALISVLTGKGSVAKVVEHAYKKGSVSGKDLDNMVAAGKITAQEAAHIKEKSSKPSIPFHEEVGG